MFLRNIARSLSFTSVGLKGSHGSKDQRQQRPQTRSPSAKVQVDTRNPSAGAAGGLLPPCAQTQPLPATDAERAHRPQSSLPADTAATTSCADNEHLQPYIDHFTSTPSVRTPGSECSSVRPAPANKNELVPTSTDSSADHNPESNFPFRPQHLQTLSYQSHHHHLTNNTAQQQSSSQASRPQSRTLLRPNNNVTGGAMQRKVWVKRPGASATRVEVNEDDLVDNVRDVILHKYANSLGRHIDSPDITLKILSREQANKNVAAERVLGPEESIGRTLDTYYPGGQTIEEALVIEVPQKRTPKPSPRPGNHHVPFYLPEEYRPGDGARDYFPPMPLQSPHLAHVQHPALPNGAMPVHSMSVLTTGQVPALPSPGAHARPRHVRPKYPRQHTSSPTILHSSQTSGIDGKTQLNGVAAPAPPLPTPPPTAGDKAATIPPNRATSPHSGKPRRKRQPTSGRDINNDPSIPQKPASANLLDGRVPPINVLLVEDNVINLKLLEQFMKRLKVRWKSAMNGKEAVNMWRQGGFHLVLMDIQLPVMNGLEATKEIRRLESVNGIGLSVFGGTTHDGKSNGNGQLAVEDQLTDRQLFKSPVIIVALTASSLQSDRHEALAVGCNDFLTKPVNFVWMERKVTEWGCMQALIDFDGWRRWKVIAEKKASEDPEKRKQEEKEEKAKAKAALKAMFSRPPPTATITKKEDSGETVTKRDKSPAGPSSTAGTLSANGTGTEPVTPRRGHKGSRSVSGGIGTTLGTTLEVDEKEG